MLLVSKGSIEQNNDLETSNVSPCFTSCVGRWESEKRTCHAEPVEQKAQTPGRRCKTPRGTCPNPSVVSLLSLLGGCGRACATWHRGKNPGVSSTGLASFRPSFSKTKAIFNPTHQIGTQSQKKKQQPLNTKMMFKKLAVATCEFLAGDL